MTMTGEPQSRATARGAATHRSFRCSLVAGGYIPYIDHETPLDVSWNNFLEYTRFVKEAAVVGL